MAFEIYQELFINDSNYFSFFKSFFDALSSKAMNSDIYS